MSPPFVSCVVPVLNGERYLHEALSSIAAQTYTNVEMIVVDDGSTDGTAQVATSGRYPVRYLAQANAGPAAARNAGILAAGGDVVAFLDADDRWHPEKLARQLALLADHPSIGASVAHAEMFRDDEDTTAMAGGRPVEVPIPAYISGTLVARRETFSRVGLFNTALKHADDTDWFLRARAMDVSVALLPDVLLYRRIHGGNMSLTGRSASFDEYLRLVKRNIDRRRRTAPPGSDS